MVVGLIKRAVRAAIEELRARRLDLVERADDRAALALGVEDDGPPPALPAPSAARLTEAPAPQEAPPEDDEALVGWVHQQRQAGVGWSEVARRAAERGHALSEEALRCRHRRWLQSSGGPAGEE